MLKNKKNKEKPGVPSPNSSEERINLSEDYEVEYWASKFGVSVKKLTQAIKEVGDNAKTVEKFLKRLKT